MQDTQTDTQTDSTSFFLLGIMRMGYLRGCSGVCICPTVGPTRSGVVALLRSSSGGIITALDFGWPHSNAFQQVLLL